MKSLLTVRISAELGREIEKVVKEEKVAVSDLIRDSLARYVCMKRFRSLRRIGLKKAAARGLFTDEDVFKIVS